MRRIYPYSLIILIWACGLRAEPGGGGASGGRGALFLAYSTTSLSNFDPDITGSPVFAGAEGLTTLGKSFRLGGGGAGGFVWGGSDNAAFAAGYGGVIVEWAPKSWLNFRMLVGGGGYSVSKVTSETLLQRVEEKVGSGGFILFLPSVGVDIPLGSVIRLGTRVGYFFPNVRKLQSPQFSLYVSFGR